MTAAEERFLSTEEVAERLQVDEQTVRRWIKSGKLEAVKPGREWRIPPGAFEALLESYSSPKARSPRPEREAAAPFSGYFKLPGLKAARERLGWSQNELAVKANVPASDISALESESLEADGDTVTRLALTLDCYKKDLTEPEMMPAFRAREKEAERLLREAANLDPEATEALRNASPGGRKLAEAIDAMVDRQAREQPEAG